MTTGKAHQVLAFRARRMNLSGLLGLVVALPVLPTEVPRWVRWFLEEVRELDPDAVPAVIDWQDDPRWTPPELDAALTARRDLVARRGKILAALDADQVRIDAEVAAGRAAAEDGPWRLITEQGDPLAAAVHAALTVLGFRVDDRDLAVPDGQPKMEDLLVTDPDIPDWESLVEIKGFTKGASPKGAMQLLIRPRQAFQTQTGRPPRSVWYIVNHNLQRPPDQRPDPLAGDSIIGVLAEADGALVDTRDLLAAATDEACGRAEAIEVRRALREARGPTPQPTTTPADGPEAAGDVPAGRPAGDAERDPALREPRDRVDRVGSLTSKCRGAAAGAPGTDCVEVTVAT